MALDIQIGNAKLDSSDTRGWLIGSFIEKTLDCDIRTILN